MRYDLFKCSYGNKNPFFCVLSKKLDLFYHSIGNTHFLNMGSVKRNFQKNNAHSRKIKREGKRKIELLYILEYVFS